MDSPIVDLSRDLETLLISNSHLNEVSRLSLSPHVKGTCHVQCLIWLLGSCKQLNHLENSLDYCSVISEFINK